MANISNQNYGGYGYNYLALGGKDAKKSQQSNYDMIQQEGQNLAKDGMTPLETDTHIFMKRVNGIVDDLMNNSDLNKCLQQLVDLGAFDVSMTVDNGKPPITTIEFTLGTKRYSIRSNDPKVANTADQINNDAQKKSATVDQFLGIKPPSIKGPTPLEASYAETLDTDLIFSNLVNYMKNDCQDKGAMNLLGTLNKAQQNQLDKIFTTFQQDIQKASQNKWQFSNFKNVDDYMKALEPQIYNIIGTKPGMPDGDILKDYVMSFIARNVVKTVMDQIPKDSFDNLEETFNRIGAAKVLDEAFVVMDGMITMNGSNNQVPLKMQMEQSDLHSFITNYEDAIRQSLYDNDVNHLNPRELWLDAIINATYQYDPKTNSFNIVLDILVPAAQNGNYPIYDADGKMMYTQYSN